MKAVHVSWALLAGLIGALLIAVGQLLQGHGDWNAIAAAILGIIGTFTPASQLGLSQFSAPAVKGDMPRYK